MTDTDKPEFLKAMGRLSVALRQEEPDVVQLRVYFEALKDLEVEFVTAAADELLKSAKWFPKAGEWRELAQSIEWQRLERQRAMLRNRLEPLCVACSDTGWEPLENGVRRCSCQALRRLEVLGRRPWPALAEASSEPGQEARALRLIEPVVAKKVMP